MLYSGHEEATAERVKRYLKDHFRDEDGTTLSDARLTEIVTDHHATLDLGAQVGRYAEYVGADIASEARLLRREREDQP